MKIVIASNNKNKIIEIGAMLKPLKAEVLSMKEAGCDIDIEETGETLAENAAIKARAVRERVKGTVILSDDSGLEVEYLAKAPGVYSARFAGPGCSYKDNNSKLLKLLKGLKPPDRKADFRTVVWVIMPDGREFRAEGRVNGFITSNMKGENGFGYDPVFSLKPGSRTFAQMSAEEKNGISHRNLAVKAALRIIKREFKAKV